MSSFQCEHCQAMIHDSPTGYTSGCEHYPKPDTPAVAPQGVSGHITAKLSNMKRKQPSIQGTDEALDSRQLGNDERYVEAAAPTPRTDAQYFDAPNEGKAILKWAKELERELAAAKAELLAWQKHTDSNTFREADERLNNLRVENERLRAEREGMVLVTFDANTIPAFLQEMAMAEDNHAGVVFVSSKTFAQNDSAGIAAALVRLRQSHKSGDWTNRIVFLTKGIA